MTISWLVTIFVIAISSYPQAFAFGPSSNLSVRHSPSYPYRTTNKSNIVLRMSAPEPSFFRDTIYHQAKESKISVPWDIKTHQRALEGVQSMFKGNVLDVGTGLGDNARWLASLPLVTSVKAVDFAPLAIQEAISRGMGSGAPIHFQEADVFQPSAIAPSASFDVLLDSAVYHCIGNDDDQRRYLKCVTSLIKVGGRAVMLVFSDENPAETWKGPRRINTLAATAMWQEAGWEIDSVDTSVRYLDSIGRCDGKGGHALLMCATRIL